MVSLVVSKEQQRRRALADAVKSRRLQLGLSQGAISERGGPSIVTVRQIEKITGPPPSGLTLSGLDLALRWSSGSAQAILDGGKATELPEETSAFPEASDVLAAIMADPRLTPVNRAHLMNQYEILLTTSAQDPMMLERHEQRRQAALQEEAALRAEAAAKQDEKVTRRLRSVKGEPPTRGKRPRKD